MPFVRTTIMESLPNELLDCIIKNLYSDTFSLLSCALVGRAWVRSSQREIFRDIVLSFPLHAISRDAYLNTTRKLVASFNSTPRLVTYVRFLELQYFLNLHENLDELHAATANVIQQLSSLNHLKFRNIRWAYLSPMLKAALARLLRTPSLTEVSFWGLYNISLAEVTSLLNRMPRQLKSLHLLAIVFEHSDQEIDEATEQDDLPPKTIKLERLTLGCSHMTELFMDWFRKDTCPFEVRSIVNISESQYGLRYG